MRRTCILKLPAVLILNLKRFEFNYDTMTRRKINSECRFPLVLDMSPYTKSTLVRVDEEALLL